MARKVFEVGDVLPQRHITIYRDSSTNSPNISIKSDSDNFNFIYYSSPWYYINGKPYYFYSSSNNNSNIVDLSSLSVEKRTISSVSDNIFSWEDSFVNYKSLEKTDIFPPAIIRFRVLGGLYFTTTGYELYTDGGSFTLATGGEDEDLYINGVKWDWDYTIFQDVDMRNWSLSKRTIAYSNYPGSDGDDIGVWEALFWEELPPSYSITFEENGGSTVTDLTEQTNLPSPLPTTTKANHVFAGWYYDNLFTQKANAGDELTANVTLYAKWYTPATWCEDIADAIREKDGTTEPIKHLDFPDKIKNIQGAKPEETKSVSPNFASGNVVVTPTSGKVMTQVTINKDSNLIAGNIKKDVTIHGITGTFEGAGGGSYSVTLNRYGSGDLYYKKDNDTNWTEFTTSTVVNNVNSLISIGRGQMSMYASLEISDSVYIISANFSSYFPNYEYTITLSNSVGLGLTYDINPKTIVVNKNLVINISVSD